MGWEISGPCPGWPPCCPTTFHSSPSGSSTRWRRRSFPASSGVRCFISCFLAAQLLFFVLCAGCYYAVLKLLAWTEDSQTPYIGLLLFPGLFFFAAELYILQTAYSFFAPIISLEEVGRHSTLLLLQVMGLAALLCTLYAYRQLCRGFQAQAELQSLTQAAHEQKVYIAEAQARYEQTKSFRHDIKTIYPSWTACSGAGSWRRAGST